MTIDKKQLSETDIRTKYITPAIEAAGWNKMTQMREEYSITAGRIIARGQVCKREKPLKADYVLFYKPNKPIAIVEAKDNKHTMSDGMQQALNYARMMNVPFVFSSNGDGFVFHNRYITEGEKETVLSLDGFPSPETLWQMYVEQNNVGPVLSKVIDEPYYVDTLCFCGFRLERNFSGGKIPAFRDPEWQAKCFAGELMVPAHRVKGMDAYEIADQCGVSYDAACVQYKHLPKE